MKSDTSPRGFWVFNHLMRWGAVLGWVIGGSLIGLQDTMRHKGPAGYKFTAPTPTSVLSYCQLASHCALGVSRFVDVFSPRLIGVVHRDIGRSVVGQILARHGQGVLGAVPKP